MKREMTRRSFVKETVLSSAGARAGARWARAEPAQPATSPAAPSPGGLPKGRIGKLESQPPDPGRQPAHPLHPQPRPEVRLCPRGPLQHRREDHGDAGPGRGRTASTPSPCTTRSIPCRSCGATARSAGGKIQWIICPTAPVEPDMTKYREHVESLVKDGCEAIYLWGVHADSLVAQGKMDLVAKAVELPKEFGVPSGVGGAFARGGQGLRSAGRQGRFLHQDLPLPQLSDSTQAGGDQRGLQ